MIAEDYSNNIRLMASYTTKIMIWEAKKATLQFFEWGTIDSTNSGVMQFCPKGIYVCPDSNVVFEAFNDCDGFNQKIIKWTIRTKPAVLRTTVTGYADYPQGEFCPVGDEFFVYTQSQNAPIYSFFTQDDLNYWTIPPQFYEGGHTNYVGNCLSAQKRVVFHSHNEDKSTFNIMVVYGNRG
jgi:hypothetical protein